MRNRIAPLALVAAFLAVGALVAGYVPKVHYENGGDKLTVESGGVVNVASGGALQLAGTDVTALLAASVAGASAGLKINVGETALDGTNATPVAHGLTTCTAFVAILKGTAAPGVGTSVLTANINGANADVYAWKVTSSGNPTLIASTGTESFYWIAIGS